MSGLISRLDREVALNEGVCRFTNFLINVGQIFRVSILRRNGIDRGTSTRSRVSGRVPPGDSTTNACPAHSTVSLFSISLTPLTQRRAPFGSRRTRVPLRCHIHCQLIHLQWILSASEYKTLLARLGMPNRASNVLRNGVSIVSM